MCSFLIFNYLLSKIDITKYNKNLKFRGPDYTNIINPSYLSTVYTFIHNLLNITGDITYQPFEKGDIITLYNGEIYNFKDFGDFSSDGECIIEAYQKYGYNFCKHLNGEFAIVLFDFNKKIFIMSTDAFSTKPLYYNINCTFLGISTYKSGLMTNKFEKEPIKLCPNTCLIYNLEDLTQINEIRLIDYNLEQTISNFNSWELAFINSIKIRSYNTKYPVFVCMSSGYDSGLICAVLNLLNIPYYTYTIIGKETKDIIDKRIEINKKKSCLEAYIVDINKKKFDTYKDYIVKNTDEFHFSVSPNRENYMKLSDDDAAIGMGIICHKASLSKHRIYLSGQGADEIISDYAMKGKSVYSNSNFNGVFPENLNEIFPKHPNDKSCEWYSFYNYTQKSYLGKEEIISGLYGIEGRYPYLDKNLVQEYLNLGTELKNSNYKAPMKYLFDKLKYPYKEEKIGFNLNLKDHAVYFTENKQIVSHTTNNNYGNTLLAKYNIGNIIKLSKDKYKVKFNIVNKTVSNGKVILYFNNNLSKELIKNRRNWVII